MKSDIFGDTKPLRASEREELERLLQKRTAPHDVIHPEIAKRASALAARLGVQIGLLIGRDGRGIQVVLGSKNRLYLPDLGRFRVDAARLRRVRLVIFVPDAEFKLTTHLRDDSLLRPARDRQQRRDSRRDFVSSLEIPRDFLTDLEKLRLDALMLVAVREDGTPGPISFAYVQPQADRSPFAGRVSSDRHIAIYYGRDIYDIEVDFVEFVTELEVMLASVVSQAKESGSERAILVGAYTGSLAEAQASMEELVELAGTAGIAISDTVVQRRRQLDPRTVIGQGKVEHIVLQAQEAGAGLLVFDRELSPSQLRSITNLTELKVIDRSMLILDIFAQRAHTSEGRLQVELAQLKYTLPRLTERDSGLSRLTGGIGGRGPGETKLEIGRRRARDRIAELERRIEKLAQQREVRRHRRQERGVPVVAIVGYTNSGKSTLLNSLTKSEVLAESKLFATLDPASRRMRFPNDREVVFVDTVGFIRELPKELVSAFRATLEEVGEADLLLQLVDVTNPEMLRQIEIVTETLDSLGFGSKPRLLALNKIDLLAEPEIRTLVNALNGLPVSAVQRTGFHELVMAVQDALAESFAGQDPGRFVHPELQPAGED